MIKSLIVKNFAIIEDLSVNFDEGMTVLTGETGAGKSLIIDTIELLLGHRADSEMIRYGETKASIEGCFSYTNTKIDELLIKYEIPKKDSLVIYREIFDSSKNVIKINGVNASLTTLKQVAINLADLHVQNDTYKLFSQDSYLDMLNPKNDSKYDKFMADYSICLLNYLEATKKYNHILKGQKESQERLEFLQYEQQELSNLNLEIGIDEQLSTEINKLENYDKVFSNLNLAYESLNGEVFSIDNIHTAASYINKISDIDKEYGDYHEKLLDCYYILDDIKNGIFDNINSLDYDAEELNQKVERLNEIEHAKAKYKKNVSELISYLEEITLQIDMVNNFSEVLETTKTMVEEKHKKLVEAANKLSNYRKKIALEIEKGIIKECQELDLEETKFEITFDTIDLTNPFNNSIFSENGIDTVDFKISFNKGEPLRSLHKVASGGEMSRIMLAFKSFFAKNNTLSVMIFDEIDTGVSGSTAKKIATKLYQISKTCQVLCITHLPQVASIGDHHIHIFKEVENDRTYTHIKKLSIDERIEELAMMLSGDKLSLYALEHAKALLNEKK